MKQFVIAIFLAVMAVGFWATLAHSESEYYGQQKVI